MRAIFALLLSVWVCCSAEPLFRVGWISDIHVGRSGLYTAPEPWDNFRFLNTNFSPAFVVATGDLTEDGTDPQFLSYSNMIATNFSCPVYHLEGNHDDSDFATYLGEHHWSVTNEGFAFIGFHSYLLEAGGVSNLFGAVYPSEIMLVSNRLADAQSGGLEPILFGHYRIQQDTIGYTNAYATVQPIWNGYGGSALTNLCTQFGVRYAFTGHEHATNQIYTSSQITNIVGPSLGINLWGPAILDAGAFNVIDFYADHIEVLAYRSEIGNYTNIISMNRTLPLTSSVTITNSLTRFGISWQFDSNHVFGTFANGDYWVVGPVTITNMTPEWDGTNHGWEVNPAYLSHQGFYAGGYSYSEDHRPALPITITSNASLVKVVGGTAESSDSIIQTAAVLTVLMSIPTDPTNTFRPPYAGTNKPLYLVSDIQTNLLPSLAAVANTPTLASIVTEFSKCLRMDHHPDNARQFRPSSAMKDYQPENTPALNEAMLRLMLNDNYADKREALILFTQHALDRAYIVQLGYRHAGTGHNPNHRIIAAWAAVLLNIAEIKTTLETAEGFHEDIYLYDGTPGPLWGEASSELAYWNYLMGLGGSRSNRDPYGLVDGGNPIRGGSGAEYQVITSQSLKGSALIARLMPELQACFATNRFETLSAYASRWVTNGAWYLPDDAAPYDGVVGNFGVTYGTNGSGGYITGSGRFPTYHSTGADAGQYRSEFVAAMWTAYSGNAAPPASTGRARVGRVRVGSWRGPQP